MLNDRQERICCLHPIETFMIRDILGLSRYYERPKLSWWWSRKRKEKILAEYETEQEKLKPLIQSRTGYNSACICQDCLTHMFLDLGDAEESQKSWRSYYNAFHRRDDRLCPQCGSKNVRSVMELIGQMCPHCKQGKVSEIDTGAIS